jgi:hypothetical protein
MAVASLTRFTVPLASNQSASAQGLLMPKLQYRFRVSFEGFGVSTDRVELTKQVVSFSRPTVSFADVDVHVYNSMVKLAGKHTWGDVSTTLRDDAAGNVTRLIGEQLQKQFDFMEQSSAASGSDYKFITRCEMLDGGNGANLPVVLEAWELYGCYLKAADYGAMNYGTNEAVTVSMTIAYDNAAQLGTNGLDTSGIGGIIGRTVGDVITGAGAA